MVTLLTMATTLNLIRQSRTMGTAKLKVEVLLVPLMAKILALIHLMEETVESEAIMEACILDLDQTAITRDHLSLPMLRSRD